MGATVKYRSGVATHQGLVRSHNEDRNYVDDESGIFLVVDGVGGQAAGEKAAETAVAVIREELSKKRGDPEKRIREAIALANNNICKLSEQNEPWRGMACVLTLALVEDDRITIGHVGDSRGYLIWNGTMRKLTSDHSPVGECEDRGELTEEEAMRHPRRNEVFREVGSSVHAADDEEFIEIRQCRFKPDAAILLCSDGLSDLLASAKIREIIERYDGDPARTAQELVNAANEAGGKDNVTALFVAGCEFLGSASRAMAGARARHSVTRLRQAPAKLASGLAVRIWRALKRLGWARWTTRGSVAGSRVPEDNRPRLRADLTGPRSGDASEE